MLSSINTYSQELQWREKNGLTKSLYQSLESFVNEETYVKIKLPSIFEVSLYDVLTKKKREKKLAEQKHIKQQEAKIFLKNTFYFLVKCLT